MSSELYKEYHQLRERIIKLKMNIGVEFNEMAEARVLFYGHSQNSSVLKHKSLSCEINKLKRIIIELKQRNSMDLKRISYLHKSIFVSHYTDEGKFLDEYYLTDEVSQEKKKLLDFLDEEVASRSKEILALTVIRENHIRERRVDELIMQPFGIILNNNYIAINRLETTIDSFDINSENPPLTEKMSSYNQALSMIDGVDPQLPKVLDLVIRDAKGLEVVNLVEKVTEILETKSHRKAKTPKNQPSRP